MFDFIHCARMWFTGKMLKVQFEIWIFIVSLFNRSIQHVAQVMHRLFLHCCDQWPEIRVAADLALQQFLCSEEGRTKQATPWLAYILPFDQQEDLKSKGP